VAARRHVLSISVAVLLFALLGAYATWRTWQSHERSLAVTDARGVAGHLAFATSPSPLASCTTTAGADHSTQFISCFTAPYIAPVGLKSEIVAAFHEAGVHISGTRCTATADVDAIGFCDVWTTHGDWHVRVTLTSNRHVPTPSQVRSAAARGVPFSTLMQRQPYQPWNGIVAVSRYK